MAGAASPDCYARAASMFAEQDGRAGTAPAAGRNAGGRERSVSRATMLARKRRAARRAQMMSKTSGVAGDGTTDLGNGIFTPKASTTSTAPKYFATGPLTADSEGPAAFERTKKQYTATSELQKCANPSKVMRATLKDLGSSSTEWAKQFEALNNVRRLARFHRDTLKPQLHSVVLRMVDCIESLRSQIAKNGLLCARDTFEYLGIAMDSEIETLAPHLLKRATDTNTFVAQEADAALRSMTSRCSPIRVLAVFESLRKHKSAPIRTKAASGVEMLARSIAPDLRQDDPQVLDKIVRLAGIFLLDRAAPARGSGREIIWSLQRSGHFEGSSGDRLTRLVSEGAQSRLRETLRRGRADTARGKPRRRPRHSPHEKKTRHARGDSSASQEVSDEINDALKRMFEGMIGTDWRKRKIATERLTVLVERTGPKALSSRIFSIFEHFNQRIVDGNVKVGVVALESVGRIVPLFKGHLSSVIPILVRTLAQQLGSTNKKVRNVTLQTFDTLIDNVGASQICPELTNAAMHSLNNHSRTILLERLCDILPSVQKSKPRQVTTQIVPVALHFLSDMRGPIGAVNTRLITQLHRLIGSKLFRIADEAGLTDKLSGIVRRGK